MGYAKKWVKNTNNIIIQTLFPIIKFVYLFIKFKNDIFKTHLYLRSRWRNMSDSKIPLDFLSEVVLPDHEYFIFNPTLTLTREKFQYFCRMSNISHKPKTNFWEREHTIDPHKKLINGTCSFELDDSYNVKNFRVVISPTVTPNFEDPRSFEIGDEIVLFGNYVQKYPFGADREFICQVGFYNLATKKFTLFDSPNRNNIEKNWIPFRFNGNKITMIYESNPLTILVIDMLSLKFEKKVISEELEFNFHGGSQFVKVSPDEYLRIVRYKFRFPKRGLVQLSFAMLHDEKLNVKFVSNPFIFQKFGFETCNGLALNNEELVFTWGEDDKKVFIGKISLKSFMEWLYNKNDIKNSKVNIFKNYSEF